MLLDGGHRLDWRTATLEDVIGAFSYTGSHTASRSLDAGRTVRTLTGHPPRDHPLTGLVEARPYRFDRPQELVRGLEGAGTRYNTYWVRFPHGEVTYRDAVANSRVLFEAAADAGVRRMVGDVRQRQLATAQSLALSTGV